VLLLESVTTEPDGEPAVLEVVGETTGSAENSAEVLDADEMTGSTEMTVLVE